MMTAPIPRVRPETVDRTSILTRAFRPGLPGREHRSQEMPTTRIPRVCPRFHRSMSWNQMTATAPRNAIAAATPIVTVEVSCTAITVGMRHMTLMRDTTTESTTRAVARMPVLAGLRSRR